VQFTVSSRGDSTVTLWQHWASDYTSRGLTYDKDKVCVIAGIIHYYGAITGKLLAQYRNGLQHPALSHVLSTALRHEPGFISAWRTSSCGMWYLGEQVGVLVSHDKVAMVESLLSTTRHMQGRPTTSADVPNVQNWRVA
jgi:hypothetical protein